MTGLTIEASGRYTNYYDGDELVVSIDQQSGEVAVYGEGGEEPFAMRDADTGEWQL